MLAADGRCKTLDAAADGYGRAEACGVMLISAHAPGTALPASCVAVLAGAAVNQDGRSSSLTAPNGPAQKDVLRAALDMAGLLPQAVTGLSMHGTGGLGLCSAVCCAVSHPMPLRQQARRWETPLKWGRRRQCLQAGMRQLGHWH